METGLHHPAKSYNFCHCCPYMTVICPAKRGKLITNNNNHLTDLTDLPGFFIVGIEMLYLPVHIAQLCKRGLSDKNGTGTMFKSYVWPVPLPDKNNIFLFGPTELRLNCVCQE